jgi:hypothetical protein
VEGEKRVNSIHQNRPNIEKAGEFLSSPHLQPDCVSRKGGIPFYLISFRGIKKKTLADSYKYFTLRSSEFIPV